MRLRLHLLLPGLAGKIKPGGWLCAIIPALLLMTAVPVSAQVTTSNLGYAEGYFEAINLTNWKSARFGTDSFGYTLNEVQLHLGTPANTSGNFFVGIYSNSGAYPGTLLETLSGPANPAATYPSYTSSGLSLAPNTYYHIVVGVTSGAGDYLWSVTSSANQSGPWDISNQFSTSANQASSWPSSTAAVMMFSVTATAIPEPSTYAMLAGLGALGLAVWRRRQGVSTIRG